MHKFYPSPFPHHRARRARWVKCTNLEACQCSCGTANWSKHTASTGNIPVKWCTRADTPTADLCSVREHLHAEMLHARCSPQRSARNLPREHTWVPASDHSSSLEGSKCASTVRSISSCSRSRYRRKAGDRQSPAVQHGSPQPSQCVDGTTTHLLLIFHRVWRPFRRSSAWPLLTSDIM